VQRATGPRLLRDRPQPAGLEPTTSRSLVKRANHRLSRHPYNYHSDENGPLLVSTAVFDTFLMESVVRGISVLGRQLQLQNMAKFKGLKLNKGLGDRTTLR